MTEWEDRLRELAGEPNEPGSFIGRWIDRLLFVDVVALGVGGVLLPLRSGSCCCADSRAAALAEEEGERGQGSEVSRLM